LEEAELDESIGVEIGPDGVAIVTRNEPPNNFLSVESLGALADLLAEIDSDRRARATVLRSAGKHFCAGANLVGSRTAGGRGLDSAALYSQAVRLFQVKKPIVAALRGSTVGGGLGLALACDFRVGTAETRLTANFAQLGFHQGFGLSVTLPKVVGHQRALELLYTGRRIGGEEAFTIGLCDRLVDVQELDRAAVALAAEIASSAPLAVESIRETLRANLASEVATALQREASEQERLFATADFREGIRASAERRQPMFLGE
jgi:2-(1,2-epoxy-1,2-dihydrophenyl)acetyl-CoA isomerase